MVGNQLQTLCGWPHALPETLVLAHPSLGLLYVLALMYTNHWQEASARLLAIEREVGLREDTLEERDLLVQVVGLSEPVGSSLGRSGGLCGHGSASAGPVTRDRYRAPHARVACWGLARCCPRLPGEWGC